MILSDSRKTGIILFCLIALLAISGCHKSAAPKAAEQLSEVTAQSCLANYLDALKKGDFNLANRYIDADKNAKKVDPTSNKLATEIFSRLEYNVLSSAGTGDTTQINVKISNIDVKTAWYNAILTKLNQNGGSLKSLKEGNLPSVGANEVVTQIKGEKTPRISKEIMVTLKKSGDIWKIQPSEAFTDSILGGLLSIANGDIGDKATKKK